MAQPRVEVTDDAAIRDPRGLVEVNPGLLTMPVYLGVTQAIEVMLEKPEGVGLPHEVRGFMATYAMPA